MFGFIKIKKNKKEEEYCVLCRSMFLLGIVILGTTLIYVFVR